MDPLTIMLCIGAYLSLCMMFSVNPFWMVTGPYKAVAGRGERKALAAKMEEVDARDKRIQLAHETRDTEEELQKQGSFDLSLTECEYENCLRCHPEPQPWYDAIEVKEPEPDPEPVRPEAVPEFAEYNVISDNQNYSIIEWVWYNNYNRKSVYRQKFRKTPEVYEVRDYDGNVLVRYDGPDRAYDPVSYSYLTYGRGRGLGSINDHYEY